MADASLAAVDEAGFDAAVMAPGGLVLLDFWAEGCVPCRQLARVLGELAPSLPGGARILTVDVRANPGLVSRFAVGSVPTLLVLKDGAVVERRTGVDRRQVLKKIVETHA